MESVIVYGASDDLVEIDGYLREEFPAWDVAKTIKASDGTEFKIKYGDDGCWRITPKKIGNKFVEMIPAVEPKGLDKHTHPKCPEVPPYSDVAIFTDGLEWISCGGRKVTRENSY